MRHVLKNWNFFVDGLGAIGELVSYTPPNLTVTLDDYRAGGLDAPVPIDMGLEALECSWALGSYNPDMMRAWGQLPATTRFTARGALVGLNGEPAVPVVHTMQGKVTGLEQAEWTGGARSDVRFTARLVYYRLEHGGAVIHEIDVLSGVRIVNGVDQLAGVRAAIGG
jgi:P2 family phage contractile tail tube protein